eukprot:TRINITY_DN750_c0_g1_i7.p1 TRINITY_DN750_c0_g1~~TRINITY_DN750_c0_g1_i7.p1  ORF type:complete len:619 (+),score=53.23 TRINITY_DN750_c0_g1_i7:535-2391(+)
MACSPLQSSSRAFESGELLQKLSPFKESPFTYSVNCQEVSEPGTLLWRAQFHSFGPTSQHPLIPISPWDDIPAFSSDVLADVYGDCIHCVCKTPAGMWMQVEVAEDEPLHPLRLRRRRMDNGEGDNLSRVATPIHYTDNSPWNICFVPQTAAHSVPPPSSPPSDSTLKDRPDGTPSPTLPSSTLDIHRECSSPALASKKPTSSKEPMSIRQLPESAQLTPALISEDSIIHWEPTKLIEIGAETRRGVGEVYVVKPIGALRVVAGPGGDISWKFIGIAVDDPMAKFLNNVGDMEKWLPGSMEQMKEWLRVCNGSDAGTGNAAVYIEKEAATSDETYMALLRAHLVWRTLRSTQPLMRHSDESDRVTPTESCLSPRVTDDLLDIAFPKAESYSSPRHLPCDDDSDSTSYKRVRSQPQSGTPISLRNPRTSICVDLSSLTSLLSDADVDPLSGALGDDSTGPPTGVPKSKNQGLTEAVHFFRSRSRRQAAIPQQMSNSSSSAPPTRCPSTSTSLSLKSSSEEDESPRSNNTRTIDSDLERDSRKAVGKIFEVSATPMRFLTLRANKRFNELSNRPTSGAFIPFLSRDTQNRTHDDGRVGKDGERRPTRSLWRRRSVSNENK